MPSCVPAFRIQTCFSQANMRPTALFIAYMAVALIVGTLIAYPVYFEFGRPIDEPMYRFVSGVGMLAVLLSSPFLLRYSPRATLTIWRSTRFRLARPCLWVRNPAARIYSPTLVIYVKTWGRVGGFK